MPLKRTPRFRSRQAAQPVHLLRAAAIALAAAVGIGGHPCVLPFPWSGPGLLQGVGSCRVWVMSRYHHRSAAGSTGAWPKSGVPMARVGCSGLEAPQDASELWAPKIKAAEDPAHRADPGFGVRSFSFEGKD